MVGAVAAGLVAISGCAGAGGGSGGSDERMSTAEYDLARDAFEKKRLREALNHVDKALEHDDDNADAAYLGTVIMLAFCALDTESPDCRFEDAEKYVRAALDVDDQMRDATNALGVILIHQRRYKEAIQVLEPLSKDIIYGSPEKAWGNLGWAYLEAGRLSDAVNALKRSVAAQPSFCVGHYRLGLAYQKKGQHGAARQAFTRAVSIEQGDCGRLQHAFWARSVSLQHLGMHDEARKDLERCRELEPKTPVGKRCARKLQALK
jgi:Tfp pilus assembly protein PilF